MSIGDVIMVTMMAEELDFDSVVVEDDDEDEREDEIMAGVEDDKVEVEVTNEFDAVTTAAASAALHPNFVQVAESSAAGNKIVRHSGAAGLVLKTICQYLAHVLENTSTGYALTTTQSLGHSSRSRTVRCMPLTLSRQNRSGSQAEIVHLTILDNTQTDPRLPGSRNISSDHRFEDRRPGMRRCF